MHVDIEKTGSCLHASVSEDVLDPIYLPFSAATLAKHFAPVGVSVNSPDDYLRYYQASADRYRAFLQTDLGQKALPLTALRSPCQIEKDERFWTAACWLQIFYASNRVATLTRLMTDCFGSQPPLATLRSWEECFEGDLRLYFEAHLPSPTSYKTWLRANLRQRNLVPYVLRAASRVGNRDFEGATHVDALLVNASNGFAVLVEAKVLSDISYQVSFDVARNQLARNIDVMLEQNPLLEPPLRERDPDKTLFVFQSPAMFKTNPRARLYGWLLQDYKNPDAILRDLPHRGGRDWGAVASRIGWLTWEDCESAFPGTCKWLAIDVNAPVERNAPPPRSQSAASANLPYMLDPTFDKPRLQKLIAEFESSAKRGIDRSLALKLRNELLESEPPYVSQPTVLQLAKWCQTNSPLYSDGMDVARRISQLLFGCVVDRHSLNV
jgi:hypothetical protein